MKRIRTFIAVPVPETVRRAAADVRTRCAAIARDLRWVAAERIHLTLKFLGDVDPDQVAVIRRRLAETATAGPFRLAARGLGVFPTVKRPRVLWMGIAGDTAPLIAFARRLDAALADAGFPPEKRPFRAHLTLGRFKGRTDPRQVADLLVSAAPETVRFDADEMVFYQSDLTPSGAVHTPLAAFPLTGDATALS